MPSSKTYLELVLEQLTPLENISARAMMGEYLLYCNGKVVGGIYDNRLLIKPTPAALLMLPNARRELPYEGGKEMLLVEDVENSELLCRLLPAISDDLPPVRKKKP